MTISFLSPAVDSSTEVRSLAMISPWLTMAMRSHSASASSR